MSEHDADAAPLDLTRRLAVMAVVNRTPDSFHEAGRTLVAEDAIAAARAAVDAGADLVDIGGLPFSPNTRDGGESVEIDRVLPVVIGAVRHGARVSVDTWRVGVARAALAAGASIINDTSGLADPDMAALAADTGASVIITHSLAAPHTHLRAPGYDDVVTRVRDFLAMRAQVAMDAGVAAERIMVDPGHDLNKNTLHSLEITRRMGEIVDLGFPVLAAVSNKDFIGESLDLDTPDRLAGSLTAATYCFAQGARMIRMHNVSAAVQAARMVEAILGWREPAYLRHNMA